MIFYIVGPSLPRSAVARFWALPVLSSSEIGPRHLSALSCDDWAWVAPISFARFRALPSSELCSLLGVARSELGSLLGFARSELK